MALATMFQYSECVQRPSRQPYPAFLVLSQTPSSVVGTVKPVSISGNVPFTILAGMAGSQERNAGFFDLPAELRLQIYDLCVSSIQVQSPFDHRFRKVNAVKHRVTDYFLLPVLFADSTFPLSLVQSSKRMAREAIDAIYRRVSFELIATHSTYMFAYNYYLMQHPMRYTDGLTLRILHDIWSSRRYENVPRLRQADWSELASLIGGMPNLKRLTVRVFHNSQNDDVDFMDGYARDGMNELAEGLQTIQRGLMGSSSNFEVEFAAPGNDFMDPGQRDRLIEFFKSKDLPVTGGNCSWMKVCTQDNGSYIWNPTRWASGDNDETDPASDTDEKPTEWA